MMKRDCRDAGLFESFIHLRERAKKVKGFFEMRAISNGSDAGWESLF
jgi:hypothetical protein